MAAKSADLSRPIAEISQGPSGFDSFMDRNQKGLMVLGLLLALGTGGWVIHRAVKNAAADTAAGELAAAEGLTDLQAVVKSHPDTPAAGSAELLIADKQWEAKDWDAAIQTLRTFIADHPDHPGLPTARASLASRLMTTGKPDEAATLFKQVAQDPKARFLAAYAYTNLGDMAKLGGRLDEAATFYQQAQQQTRGGGLFAGSSASSPHLELLRFKMPTEIDAPATPAPLAPTGSDDLEGSAGIPPELQDNPLIKDNFGPPTGVTPPEEAPAPDPGETAPPSPPVPPAPPVEDGKSN